MLRKHPGGTVLYNLNPADNALFVTMAGAFAAVLRGVRGGGVLLAFWMTPTMTLACTASTWRMATEVSSGKPNTTPATCGKVRRNP